MVEQGLAPVGKPSGKRPGKKRAEKSATGKRPASLNEAIGKVLKQNSDKIARSLLEGTLKGNVSCARLFLELAKGQEDNPNQEAKRDFPSQAMALAMEPEWVPEAMETTASIRADGAVRQAGDY